MRLGIIVGSFKPFTSGHSFLINQAIKENELINLFVSTTDRIKKNEHPIYWKQMKIIWEKCIIPTFPDKVKIFFEPNPMVAMYEFLKTANETLDDHNIYTYYADHKDTKYITNPRIALNFPRLTNNNQLRNISISRNDNINVSGTMARKAISEGDMKKFITMLPEDQQKAFGEFIYNLLSGY